MYKTIVVHIDGSEQQESRLRAAALLAVKHGAHLIGSGATGISWMEYSLLTGSMAAPVIGDDFQGLRDAVAKRLEEFKAVAAHLGIESVEARMIEDDPRYALLLQSRYADLVVLSQDSGREAGLPARVRGLPEHVALRGARPVLVVPPSYLGEPPCCRSCMATSRAPTWPSTSRGMAPRSRWWWNAPAPPAARPCARWPATAAPA
jgi:nucleotide-binding universal stress UspA family protein